MFLKKDGVCRVHGGGFAGTIQAFVKNEAVKEYKETLDKVYKVYNEMSSNIYSGKSFK